jgi:hypothetical protein
MSGFRSIEHVERWIESQLRLAYFCGMKPAELEYTLLLALSPIFVIKEVWVAQDGLTAEVKVYGGRTDPDCVLVAFFEPMQ